MAAKVIDTTGLRWAPVDDSDFGSGGHRRQLAADPEIGATALHLLAEPFRSVVAGAIGLYVIEGRGSVNDQRFDAACYLRIEPGHVDFHPEGGVTALVLTGWPGDPGQSETLPPSPVTVVDTTERAWRPTQPEGEGAPTAFSKEIASDDLGRVFLSAFLPGHVSWHRESHPVAEEVFRLSGSLYDASTGWSHPGSYALRPAGLWHGPLASIDGTVSLVRASGPITTVHRDPDPDWVGIGSARRAAGYRPPSLEGPNQ